MDDGMNFTELVQRKIEERREGRSASVQAAAEADGRFRTRVAPLRAALSDMIERLSDDPMFANAMGRPEVTVQRDDKNGREGALRFEGRVGMISFLIHADGKAWMRVYPNWAVMAALDCGITYQIEPVRGELSDIDDLIQRACDHLSDFFADIYLSPAAHLLEPERGAGPTHEKFGTLGLE